MSKLKRLSSFFKSGIKANAPAAVAATTASSSSASASADNKALKQYVSSLFSSSSSSSSAAAAAAATLISKFSLGTKWSIKKSPSRRRSSLPALKLEASSASDSEDGTKQLSEEISSILCESSSADLNDLYEDSDEEDCLEGTLKIPWFPGLTNGSISQHRKEVTRKRKQKWVYKSGQIGRVNKLIDSCAGKLGTQATVEIFGKLGCETGLKEYNKMIEVCVARASKSTDEDTAIEQISIAFKVFKKMKEQGFQLEDETYRPLLMYLIDTYMVQEFHFLCDAIRADYPNSKARLGYYEMLLYIRVDDEEKIQELCDCIDTEDGEATIGLRENYLLALCESDRKEDLLKLLEKMDITKLASLDHIPGIFKCLGRLSLESFAKKYLLELKKCGYAREKISTLLISYTTSIPNLVVEDIVLKFNELHRGLEMIPPSTSYEKLIVYCCSINQVHMAVDMVEQMCKAGLTLSIDTVNSLLHASEESFEFNLVRRIYALVCQYDLKPTSETFRSMISLTVRMKDFNGAYDMLNDLKKFNLTCTAGMYNAIMGGYYREKNVKGALMVLKQMREADVKPDSQTYGYLITNCDTEENIIRYYEDMKTANVQVSKQIFMSLINAYAACGQFEKAKQVLLDTGISVKNLNEIKSVLVSALASHGRMGDALDIYKEMKEAGSYLEPKAVIAIIEHYQSDGELWKLLDLLEELEDPNYWVDGCCRVILHCVRNKHLDSAVKLLKQLTDMYCEDELAMEGLFDEVFSQIADLDPPDLETGLHLLQVIKVELGVTPSRKYLDFLLGACVKAKDLASSLKVWREYEEAGLPYNVLTHLRMYQALLASGGKKSAKKILSKIPRDDAHVCLMIQKYQKAYGQPVKGKGKNKKKQKE